MSTEFGSQLTAMFDDAAAAITPRSDYGAVRSAVAGGATITAISTSPGGAPFHRGALAAAAALVLLAGGAAAYQAVDGSEDTMSTSADMTPVVEAPAPTAASPEQEPSPAADLGDASEPADAPPAPDIIERSAFVAATDFDRDPPVVEVRGSAPDGETVQVSSFAGVATTTADGGAWAIRLEVTGAIPDGPLVLLISFGSSDETMKISVETPTTTSKDATDEVAEPKDDAPEAEEPKTEEPKTEEPKVEEPKVEEPKVEEPKVEEPKVEEPKQVDFTAKLGGTWLDHEPPKVGLHGTGQPGTHVSASSEFGEQIVRVGEQGGWEMWLYLPGLDPGETARIQVLNSVNPAVKTFEVTRKSEPEHVTFTAKRVEGVVEGDPIWQRFGGTGQPGSAVIATSDHGSADTVVGEGGEWTLKLWLEGVPAGKKVVVLVSNPASGITKEFVVEKPPAAPAVAFTANAAFVECDSNPPYNEYWGTAQPGTTVKIVSPYGWAERTAGPEGGWDARVEFPDAPFGETFIVKVKSIATGEYREFPMKRVEAG